VQFTMDLSDEELKKTFDMVVGNLKSLPTEGFIAPSNEQKLQVYSLFKQATEGDCKGSAPSIFSPIARAKWYAWDKLRGMSRSEAMQKYIHFLANIVEALDPSELTEKQRSEREAFLVKLQPKPAMSQPPCAAPTQTPPASETPSSSPSILSANPSPIILMGNGVVVDAEAAPTNGVKAVPSQKKSSRTKKHKAPNRISNGTSVGPTGTIRRSPLPKATTSAASLSAPSSSVTTASVLSHFSSPTFSSPPTAGSDIVTAALLDSTESFSSSSSSTSSTNDGLDIEAKFEAPSNVVSSDSFAYQNKLSALFAAQEENMSTLDALHERFNEIVGQHSIAFSTSTPTAGASVVIDNQLLRDEIQKIATAIEERLRAKKTEYAAAEAKWQFKISEFEALQQQLLLKVQRLEQKFQSQKPPEPLFACASPYLRYAFDTAK